MAMVDEKRQFCSLLGWEVNALRAERGMTMEQLAEEAGVSKSMLEKLAYNGTEPGAYTLYRIARALGADIGELLSGCEV